MRSPDYEALSDLILKHHAETDSIKRFFVLTDNNCMSCNTKFAHFARKYARDASTVIVVTGENLIDVSKFSNRKNVIFANAAESGRFFCESKVIYVHDGDIDMIVRIDPGMIEGQMRYVKFRK